MHMNTSPRTLGAAAFTLAVALLPAFPVAALHATSTASSTPASAAANAKLTALITKADSDIAARINALNDLSARVQTMKNVSSDQVTAISNDVQTNITGLTALQAKIDADTDLAVAKTDAKGIFGDFRIYALIVPRGWILASTDRITAVTTLMSKLSDNIQTRVTAAQSSGKNVSSLTPLVADLTAKITDAKTQAGSAQSGVAALAPDQGDKAKIASNHAALVAARTAIKTATADITAARKDIATLVATLKTLDGGAPAAASSTTP